MIKNEGKKLSSITVFCGSSPGADGIYTRIAFELGQFLADQNIRVIYGGAKIGVMGALADGALQNKGEVIGVIPKFLSSKEIAHDKVTKLEVVETMHERKTMMNHLSDGVIALPGGYGTLEELFEMLTWAQLGLHQKPIALLNINNYFDHLIALRDHMMNEGFINNNHKKMMIVSDNIEDLIKNMQNYIAPELPHWLKEQNT